jgi:hypothetical protein
MGKHTEWPQDKYKAPVWITAIGNPNEILADGSISAELNATGTKILGIVFDADLEFDNRWKRVKQICEKLFDSVPAQMPAGGLILQDHAQGQRLGVWIMPDNAKHGMLETFLEGLVTKGNSPPFAFAESVVAEARKNRAPCRECHIDKAEIHSWLAWQDPPGLSLGRAITAQTLDPHSDSAIPFVEWFLKLYNLKALNEQEHQGG